MISIISNVITLIQSEWHQSYGPYDGLGPNLTVIHIKMDGNGRSVIVDIGPIVAFEPEYTD